MEAAELALFRRSVEQACGSCSGAALDEALGALGWQEAMSQEGGAALSVLFEAQGAANAASGALDQVLAVTMDAPVGPDSVAVILPALRRVEPPGRMSSSGRCEVRGLGGGAFGRRSVAVVAVADGRTTRALSVPTASLTARPVAGLDPALGLVEISGDVEVGATEDLGMVAWTEAVAAGQLALGHELVGAARTMLELARTHALSRVQFGRPIGSFQAVRHRLAEGLVAVEAAAGLLTAGWNEPTPAVAAMAKGMAGRSARTVARHAQQVLAGIGLHRRASPAPFRPAHPGARSAAGGRDRVDPAAGERRARTTGAAGSLPALSSSRAMAGCARCRLCS